MFEDLDRRRFLQSTGAGATLLTVPSFLAGCMKNNGHTTTPLGATDNPFMDWFGVDEGVEPEARDIPAEHVSERLLAPSQTEMRGDEVAVREGDESIFEIGREKKCSARRARSERAQQLEALRALFPTQLWRRDVFVLSLAEAELTR